jgi:hypothetical protein
MLFDMSNSVIWCISFFDTQRPNGVPIEVLVENETTEQMNIETAQQVSERNRFWWCFTGNGDIHVYVSVCVCVCVCKTFIELGKSVKEQILIYNDGPDNAGPIVCCPVGLPITAGCDTAWILTRDVSDASCTEMQCLRQLCPCVC